MMQAVLGAIVPQLASVLLDAVLRRVKNNAPKEVAEALESVFTSLEKKAELEREIMQIVLQYNEQLVKELEVREKYKTTGLGSYVRPVMTFFTAGMFNIAMVVGLFLNKISFQEFIATIAPINTMLWGFWFGERSALKDPRRGVVDDG